MMKQDNSFGNIKNMQKQQRLFTLVHLINSRAQGRQIINILLITVSLLGNIINFLSLKQIGILKSQIFVLNSIFNMIFIPILGLILVQLLIGYFYQLEFFISVQWKIFRFIIYPFIMSYLLSQASTGSFLNPTIAVVLFALILFISLLLTAVFATQSYIYKKLLHRELPINFYLLIIQTLFYICNTIKNINIEITASLLITILAYNIYNNNFVVLKQNSIQFRILCVNTFLLLWAGMVFTVALFTEANNILSLIVASIPCLLYKIFSDFTRERAPVPYRSFASIFDDPDTIYFQEFIDSLQPIIQQIMDYYYSQNKKDFVQTLLISYYYQHSNRCINAQCPFRNQDYKYELRNMNDSKNMKQVLFKICKKIDFLYYGMYKTWPQHIDLKLSLVQFYIFCFPNKIRALQIISQIQLSKLTIQQEYQLFRVKILCQNMNSLQVAGEIKLDERLMEFENLVYLTLNTMMEFWSLFYQEKIDFNKLTNITSKIFPLRKKIEEIFQSRLSQQTFSTLQILKLYSIYSGAIQNNEEKSWKINDYLSKLHSKLQQHKQIEYLSFDSEIGLVALSLSENKLGTIAMVNGQAASIFNYSKKQFKTIRVNEIMPRTFAQQHDNYLKVFLQNRTKKINSDERKLLGKNKAGYIFPILLQLQRTVSSTGDELLFIANIKKLKLKMATVTCVTDEEGQICDYSSTFDYLFYRQQKMKVRTQHKNIQEFIPEFFDPNIEEDENTQFKHFKQLITLKNYGKVEIAYTVAPVAFPLKQNGGYIVQGHVIPDDKPILFPNLSMTDSLKSMMNRQILSAHKTYYNPQTNKYELSKQQEPININDQFGKQFTIPFININDVTDIFGMKKQIITYGQQIKTIRLVKDHFQRVQDQSQFMSQLQQQKTQSTQTINQIMQLKQSILKQKKPTFMRNIKIGLILISLACIIVFFVLINQYNNYSSFKMFSLYEVKSKHQTRGYLSQYIIYFTVLSKGFDPLIYQPKLQSTRDDLINTMEDSPILESRKQNILKVAYLQNQADLSVILQQLAQDYRFNYQDVIYPIMTSWYAFFVLLAILIFITTSSYFMFLNQLENVYQVFMCLEQKIIKKLYMQCKNLAKIIQKGSQKDKKQQQPTEQYKSANVKQTEQNEEDQQNPVKKIRKFKKDQKFRNLFLFIKLIFPFILIIILGIFTLAQISTHNSQIEQKVIIHNKIVKIIPQTSLFLMNTLIKNSLNYTTYLSKYFTSSYQNIDQLLFSYEQNYRGQVSQSFFITLLGNVCKNSQSLQSKTDLCNSITQGTLKVGLSKAINFLTNSLTALQKVPLNSTLIDQFNDFILLEYDFIFPLVEHMIKLMYDELDVETGNFSYEYSTLGIVIIMLIAMNFLYFLRYPAYEIQQKIHLSKGLIDLLPEYYKNERAAANKQGYAQVKNEK